MWLDGYMVNFQVISGGWCKKKLEAPPRFELGISCLLDRRFNQLSHGAGHAKQASKLDNNLYTFQAQEISMGWKSFVAQRGARTHDPEIKSLMLYRLS